MVLMRLALVVRYGDLSDQVDRCSADLRSTLKWDEHEMSAGIGDVGLEPSLMHAKTLRFCRHSNRGLHGYCLRQHQPESL
jgi:hypothetical protein